MGELLAAMRLGVLMILLLACTLARAAATPPPLTGTEAMRVAQLTSELRCVVCQNQSIAESQAPLAVELREQVREQVATGATDAQVMDFMVQRYGDFVRYKPPLKPLTLALWLGPAVMLGIGVVTLWRRVRQQALDLEAEDVPMAAAGGGEGADGLAVAARGIST